jgi:hypothetical protein
MSGHGEEDPDDGEDDEELDESEPTLRSALLRPARGRD